MSDGEVAVRQNGHEHAVDAPRLDDQLHIDLDHVEAPRVQLPSEVAVEYRDREEDLETDGGKPVNRSSIQMRGDQTISDELVVWTIIASGLLLMSAGYLFGIDSSGSGLIAIAGGALLAYLAIPSFWRDEP